MNSQSKPQETAFSFGVGSLFVSEHLGGFRAILGYTYVGQELEICFHRIKVENRFATLKHPNVDLMYTTDQALKHLTYPDFSFPGSGNVLLCVRRTDGKMQCITLATNSNSRTVDIDYIVPTGHLTDYAYATAPNNK